MRRSAKGKARMMAGLGVVAIMTAVTALGGLGLAALCTGAEAQVLVQAEAQNLAQADLPRIQGRWALAIELASGRCRWRGGVNLRQRGREITGRGAVSPTGRARLCPPLGGAIKGRITGPRIGFGFATGALGRARFDGTYDPATDTMEGTFRARAAGGSWRAERVR